MSFTFVCITVGRLQDVEVYFAREKNAYTLVNYQAGVAGDSVTFTEDMFARWIKVTRRTPFKALSLCEVLVYGFLPDDTGKNTCCCFLIALVFLFLFAHAQNLKILKSQILGQLKDSDTNTQIHLIKAIFI